MKKKLAVAALAFILAIVFCAPALYAETLKDKFFKKVRFIMKNHEELGLSDEQFDEIKKLKTETKKDIIRKKSQTEVLDVEIHTEMWEDPTNLNTINALIEQKYDIKREKTKNIAEAYSELMKILTQEQRDKLKGLWLKK